ncbi:hypothetical protein DNK44_09985 [Pseudomonas dryadis]|uniref:Uncharacterized protein n=2 Tax=Phytopseudomonas dryadis TaxID=2487520 RepID=A0A4Q9R2Y0_9GAMM|nr:hypothetical protein DNK44_09985 [Pseudomonas dryadis]
MPMLSRRTWLRLLVPLLLSLLLIGALYTGGRYLLQRNGIQQLDWSGLGLSTAGLHLERLALRQHSSAGSLDVRAEGLLLGWRQFGLSLPFWQQIEVRRLALDWHAQAPSDNAEQAQSAPLDLQRLAAPLAIVPRQLHITELSVELPCAAGRCTARGDLRLQRSEDDRLALQLDLLQGEQRLNWTASLHQQDDALNLQLGLGVDGQAQIELHSQLSQRPETLAWSGELNAPQLSQAGALQQWLAAWLLPPGTQWPAAPGAASLTASWQLQLPRDDLSLAGLLAGSGAFAAEANLPQPWPVPGIGQVQGQLALAAHSEDAQWIAQRLEADLQLRPLGADWQAQLPPALRSEALHLRVRPGNALPQLRSELAGRALPLDIALEVQGATALDLQGTLAVANAAPWALQFADTRLTGTSKHLTQGGWQASGLKTTLRLGGYLDAQRLELDLAQGAQISAAALSGDALRLQQLQASIGGGSLRARLQDGGLQDWQFKGPLNLTSKRLEQANLKPQGWRWQGQVEASSQSSMLRGKLSNDSALQLDLDASLDAQQRVRLKATLAELFLRSGNPLANTLAQWPELLELNNGRLNATAQLGLAPGSATPDLVLNVTGKGLGGIYDRSELSGLDTRLHVKLAGQRFALNIAELRLEQANPGLPIGPIQAHGSYSATLAAPDQGQVQLGQAQAALMGGRVTLTPGQWQLGGDDLRFAVQLQGLELQQLFTLYPAEGLAGSGTLDGQLPLRLGKAGIEVEQGHIAAREPGGRLQFSSEKIKALGRSNPAMQLVTQSLEDFNFTTLNSSVDYDEHGKLRLGMRLEGQNPAIENGRPIHFNINLEEDIPNLLASLQLTDRVNEIITRRVQQRMLQRNTAPKEP